MRVFKITIFSRDAEGGMQYDVRTVVLTSEQFRKVRFLLAETHDGNYLVEETQALDFTNAKDWIKNA